MKRRDFIKTSVGAGFAVSTTPFTARYDQLAPRELQQAATLFDKIWDSHVVANLGGDTDLLQVDRCIGGSPNQVLDLLEEGIEIQNPEIFFSVPDHGVSTSPDRYTDRSLGTGWQAYEEHAEEMREMGFNTFGQFDPRHGIQHVVGPETGLSQPGMVLCAGDSHTCTHGAMGLISWGGESSGNILRTGTVIRLRPMTMRVNLVGRLGPGLRSKDIILRIISQLGTDSGSGYAVEYGGPVVRALPQEARFTICNLAVEMASLTGMVGPDDTTFEWLKGREFAPADRYWDQAVRFWRTLSTDEGAVFDREETIDMTGVDPQVTWGINPEHAIGIGDRFPIPMTHPRRSGRRTGRPLSTAASPRVSPFWERRSTKRSSDPAPRVESVIFARLPRWSKAAGSHPTSSPRGSLQGHSQLSVRQRRRAWTASLGRRDSSGVSPAARSATARTATMSRGVTAACRTPIATTSAARAEAPTPFWPARPR